MDRQIKLNSILFISYVILGLIGNVNYEIAGINIPELIVLIVAVIALLVAVLVGDNDALSILGKRDIVVRLIQIAIIFEIIVTVIGLIRNDDILANAQMKCVILGGLISALLFVKGIHIGQIVYEMIFYISLMATATICIAQLTPIEDSILEVIPLLSDEQLQSGIVMLFMIITLYLYIKSVDKLQDTIFIIGGVLGSFTMATGTTVVARIFLLIVFLLFPILFIPTAKTVRKSGIMTGIYILVLSNVSLIPYLFENTFLSIDISLEGSVYLDILLVTLGLVYFHYYDKIPEGADENRLIMRKMHRGYIYVLSVVLIITALLMSLGDRADEMVDASLFKGLGIIGGLVTRSANGYRSLVYRLAEKGNAIVFLLIIAIGLILLYRAFCNYSNKDENKTLALIVSIAFVLQIVTYGVSYIAALAYTCFLLYTLYGADATVEYSISRYQEKNQTKAADSKDSTREETDDNSNRPKCEEDSEEGVKDTNE